MASELTDKIRTAYPHQYDDLSDSELEAKILAKHPEYKDLTTSKSTSDTGPQTEVTPKREGNTSITAPLSALESNMDASNKRDEESIDSTPKVRSEGNLEALRATDQHNIIAPEEHESLLSKGWKLLDNPLVHRIVTGDSPELSKMREELGIKGVQGPELMKIPGMNTLANTIREKGISSGEYSKGFAASILGDLIDAVSSGFDPRNAATKESPMDLFPVDHLPENVPEGTPVFKGHEPANASEQFPELKESLLNHNPDLVPVGEEPTINKGINKSTVNPEDRLLELAKQKQGMGLSNPIDSDVNSIDDVHKAQLPKDLKGAKPRFNMGSDSYDPQFKSDLDKALFIIAQKTPSRRDADYLKFVMETTGLSEQEARNAGLKVKSQVKDLLRNNDPGAVDIPQLFEQTKNNLVNNKSDIPSPPTNVSPIFNGRSKVGETGTIQSSLNKPRLLLNADGSFINKETGEMFDMRGHKIDPSEHKPGSLIDMTDQMNNKEITHDGGSDNQLPEPPNPNEPPEKHKTTFSDIINLPKALKASFDLSAPGRQGLGLIHTKEWWGAWNDMFKGLQSDKAFKATQQAINNRPLFKSFGDEPSFAQKVGLKLTNLGKLSEREETFMSGIAEKFPGVKPSERAYTAYLNKLRADTFENLMSKYKVLGENGEYNIPLAKELANYINNATGRGSLDALESSAVALNNAFFSPRFFASRLKLLGEGGKSVFTPSTYVFSQPNIRREYLKSLLAIAGVGTTIGELAKLGGASVEHDPTNSDFMKIKVGNTRIDPYAGMQQPVVLASRLLSGKSTSSTSGKTTDLDNPKYGQSNRMDVIGRFARSKESPALSFVHGLLAGKDNAGKKFDVPEEVVNLFVPMVLQDLKSVATENPNLIPYLHEQGLGFENTDVPRSMLAIPGVFGASVQNYSNSKSN